MSLSLALRMAGKRAVPRVSVPCTTPGFGRATGLRWASSTSGGGASRHPGGVKLFFKSNAAYVTYIVLGCVIVETIWSKSIEAAWDSVNSGKQYKDVSITTPMAFWVLVALDVLCEGRLRGLMTVGD